MGNNHISRLLCTAACLFFILTSSAQGVTSPNGRLSAKAEGKTLVISYEGKKALQMEELPFTNSDFSFVRNVKEDFDVICERKEHPKEGSYTNYLFTKGLDKILKKCGEEASEIIIAAKNPENDELIYEMADFLYHMMVLMAERGLTWQDITKELANRRR